MIQMSKFESLTKNIDKTFKNQLNARGISVKKNSEISINNNKYEDHIKNIQSNSEILIIDAMNIYRSSSKCVCNNHQSILRIGELNDFQSFASFWTIFITLILNNHYVKEKADVPLVIDLVTRPSDWKRGYVNHPCSYDENGEDHITNSNEFVHIENKESMLEVSCKRTYLQCSMDVIREYVKNKYDHLQHLKPIIRYSICFEDQEIVPSQGSSLEKAKNKQIRGIDDILCIKKALFYSRMGFVTNFLTCDKQVSNSVMVQKNNTPGFSNEKIDEDTSSNVYSDHTATIHIDSTPVDFKEIYISNNNNKPMLYTHSSINIWEDLTGNDQKFKGFTFAPGDYFKNPSHLFSCINSDSSCKKFTIRRKDPLPGHTRTIDEQDRFYFKRTQIILDVSRSNNVTTTPFLTNIEIETPSWNRECTQFFMKKECDIKNFEDFKNMLKFYMTALQDFAVMDTI